jgi:glutamate/aspartate transport system substrate-binding protein
MRVSLPKIIVWIAGFAIACSAVAALAASPTLDRIRETQTIALAYRDQAAPFSFKDRQGRPRGYSVELCTRIVAALQQALGLKELRITWQLVSADERLDAVASGKADAECGITTISLSRLAQVDFSLPIFVDGGSALVRSKAGITRLDDLKGRKVAVIAGTTTEQALEHALNVIGAKATLIRVHDPNEGLALLQTHKADAYAADRIVLAELKLRAPDGAGLAVLNTDFSYEPYGIVVRRDDPDFRLAINRALVGIYKRGEIDAIFQQWLAPLGRPSTLLHSMYYLNALPD